MSQRLACGSRLGSVAGGFTAALVLPVPSTNGLRSLVGHTAELPREPTAIDTALTTEKKRGCVMSALPYYVRGEVVRGFGRGSKELGIPTANFPEHVVDNLPADLTTGIYYGWGCVGGEVYKMVMSIGWNPFYKNTKKSVETHIIHQFDEDFYGEILTIVIVGYIRPEESFKSLDALISAIHNDIEEAKEKLDLPEYRKLKDNYFSTSPKIMNGH